jgi:hypothetical protein
MPTTQCSQSSNTEGRILLALDTVKKGHISSFQAAAKLYNVPPLILSHQARGRTAKEDSRSGNLKLSVTEEATLSQWILSMDERGKAPRIAAV